jgi:hypothetical protein
MRRTILLLATLLAAGSPALAQTWTQLPDGYPRVYQRAIYDSLRARMLVFAGADSQFKNDTHQLSLSGAPTWTTLSPTPVDTLPDVRDAHGLIYDPVRDRMLLFGGANVFGLTTLEYNDVWVMSLGPNPRWTKLAPTGTKPAARHAHNMIYDPVRDRVVIFGGRDVIGPRNDVWALSLSDSLAWMQLVPSGTPPTAREHAAAIYDPLRDRMIVFGGFDGKPTWNGDVWELTFSPLAWNKITPAVTGPTARDRLPAIYDPVNDRMVIFGGRDGSGHWQNDVWGLSLSGTSAWTQIMPTGGSIPPARWGHSGIYDAADRQMVIFGGSTTAGVHLSDAWALSLGPPVAVGDVPPGSRLSPISAGPNPARGEWTIQFRTSEAAHVSLRVYDAAGRAVRDLASGWMDAGAHSLRWNLRSTSGRRVPAGVYFYELADGAARRVRHAFVVIGE